MLDIFLQTFLWMEYPTKLFKYNTTKLNHRLNKI